jgi:hypothetical protein
VKFQAFWVPQLRLLLQCYQKGKEKWEGGVNPLAAGVFGGRRMREEVVGCADR